MNINENTIVNFTNVAFTNALNNYGGVMQSKGTVNLNNVSITKTLKNQEVLLLQVQYTILV